MKQRLKPWPLSDRDISYSKHRVYYGLISTGVIVFSVIDWGRGESDIDSRARGVMAGRGCAKLVRAGHSERSVPDECYPNIASAAQRWWNFGPALMQGKDIS